MHKNRRILRITYFLKIVIFEGVITEETGQNIFLIMEPI
jgi:hypothetical protein